MKRVALIAIAVLAVGGLGLHWHIVGQLESGLERISAQLAPIGRLEWDRVRIDFRGHAHVERAELTLRESRDPIRAEQIVLSAGGLLALPGLARELNALHLPAPLDFRIEGLTLPVNRELEAWIGQPGLAMPFPAAGCAGFEDFGFYDLGKLGLVELAIDLHIEIQKASEGRELDINQRLRSRGLADRRLRLRLAPPSWPVLTSELPAALRASRVVRAEMEYLDQGFYPRLLAFCAEQGGTDSEQQIDRHVAAWVAQWAQSGFQPAPLVVAGYRHFLHQPELLSLQLLHPGGLRLDRLEDIDLEHWLSGLEAGFSINHGTIIDLGLTAIEPAAQTEAVTEAPVAVRPEPDSEIRTELDITLGTATDWSEVTPGQAAGHLGQRAEIMLHDGQRYSGRIAAVDAEFIHLTSRSRIGEFTRPIARDQIESMRVRP